MKCPQCGNEIGEALLFCPSCGARIQEKEKLELSSIMLESHNHKEMGRKRVELGTNPGSALHLFWRLDQA